MAALEDESSLSQYKEAFASIKRARNVLGFLIALAIVMQMASFISVYFGGVIDATQQLPGAQQAETSSSAQAWLQLLRFTMSGTMFITPILGALLVLTYLFAVKLVLLGRLDGLCALLSTFYWSLFLLALLVPWQRMFNSTLVCGMPADLEELIRWTGRYKRSWRGGNPPFWGQIAYFARFLAYPILVLTVWIVTQLKFARGYGQMRGQVAEVVGEQTAEPGEAPQQNRQEPQQLTYTTENRPADGAP